MTDTSPAPITPSTAIGRWVGLGPYYAMFPAQFAFEVVHEYCPPGGSVLDPFAGRASSIYAAVAQNRSGYGIEINPVGWLYGRVKLDPADEGEVAARIQSLSYLSAMVDCTTIEQLPEFFHVCYAPQVLRFLVTAREMLRWKDNGIDATLMAIILVYLHGKSSQSLSNQMRQGKAMSPDYCVRWWRKRQSSAPDIDPAEFLTRRVRWRYAKGRPILGAGTVELGDSISVLPRLGARMQDLNLEKFDLLFTSPPYFAVTNYNYDQWLRIWMLGGEPWPVRSRGIWQNKFESRPAYRTLLQRVFEESAEVLHESATVYVRTDARQFTYDTTVEVLRSIFPHKRLRCEHRPYVRQTQTALFGDKRQKPGEVDLILEP